MAVPLSRQKKTLMVMYTVPGMKSDDAEREARLLQDRLNAFNDLALTLKHVHWNVTGSDFVAVHTMVRTAAPTVPPGGSAAPTRRQ